MQLCMKKEEEGVKCMLNEGEMAGTETNVCISAEIFHKALVY